MNALRHRYGGHVARAFRLIAGLALLWSLGAAVLSPIVPPVASTLALAVLAVSLWQPAVGLVLAAALTPAGLLMAPAPTRAAEMIAWAFLSAWLLRIWRPLASAGWPRPVVMPAALLAFGTVTSWLALTIRDAGGIDPNALPLFIARAIGTDHLAVTSPEVETWTMLLAVAGLGVLMASAALARETPGLARRVAAALAASMAVLSLASIASIVQQWSAQNYAGWFIARYATSERFTLHLSDLNAAGSQYVLALLTAAGVAAVDQRRRWMWGVLLGLMLPGLWLTGSRSAGIAAAAVGALVIVAARERRWRPSRAQIAGLVAAAIVLLLVGGVILARGVNERNAAGRAMRLRAQFTETSARMFATAPIYGVGIGRYHERSGQFMPAELRSLYGVENAHNYFAQELAELGLVGGALFVWLVAAMLAAGWRLARGGRTHAGIGLFAGCVGYLVTCLTGHPLLVPEAALPFWCAMGAVVGSAPQDPPTQASTPRARLVAALLVVLLAVPIGLAAVSYRNTQGREQGFYDLERADDGVRFRWTTRHAVTYINSRPGFLAFEVRAVDVPGGKPFELTTEIDGRIVDSRRVPADHWASIEIPVRPRPKSTSSLQRVDLRVSRTWSRPQRVGQRMTTMPVGIMVRQLRWTPAG